MCCRAWEWLLQVQHIVSVGGRQCGTVLFAGYLDRQGMRLLLRRTCCQFDHQSGGAW